MKIIFPKSKCGLEKKIGIEELKSEMETQEERETNAD